MNWAVLKDAKWLSLTVTSLLLGVIGIVLAIYNNSYWAYFVIISAIFTFLGANRGDQLTGL
ncbi:hypothetical protein [Lentibacillus salinarum]|uniref:Uncharacterized protein n=1 Tax=Lentibacillus salinarum TaxID=446820 RepID=A0ABW3ZYV5_9BACI